jgi:Family of unknown function (DUF6069)
MTINSSTTPEVLAARTAPFSRRRFVVVVAVAVVLNVLLFVIGSASGASMIISSPIRIPITVVIVIFATAFALGVAGLATWLIARRVPTFRTRIAWIGAVLAILSGSVPSLVSADVPTGIFLGSMHVVGGIVWFVALMSGRKALRATPAP